MPLRKMWERRIQKRDSQDTVQLIYDNDPSIQYSDGWDLNHFFDTSQSPPIPETSHSTAQAGSTIFVSFHGVRITIAGRIPAGDAPLAATYIIDNGPGSTRQVPTTAQDTNITTGFFQSSLLGNRPHNLTVHVNQSGGGRNYTFQQFNVTTGVGQNGTGSTSNTSKSHGISSAAIVGIALGGVMCVLVFFGCYYFRKYCLVHNLVRKSGIEEQTRNPQNISVHEVESTSVINPFVLPPPDREMPRPFSVRSHSTGLPSYSEGMPVERSMQRASYAASHASTSSRSDGSPPALSMQKPYNR